MAQLSEEGLIPYFQDARKRTCKVKRLDVANSIPAKSSARLKNEFNQVGDMKQVNFIVHGQCTLFFENKSQKKIVVAFPFEHNKGSNTEEEFLVLVIEEKLSGKKSGIYVVHSESGNYRQVAQFNLVQVDADANAPYWVSFYGAERAVKYGIGEARQGLALIKYELPAGPNPDDGELKKVDKVLLSSNLTERAIEYDPVTIEPPLRILPTSLLTIDGAAGDFYGSWANLTKPCQKLYHNIAGENFKLDTSDFPEFSQAIEKSIRDPNGWCHQKLKEKESEFSHKHPNIGETYLRITLGTNQGDSPGIPYVVEIWPPGHFSPIHCHAQAHAIIRVLYGQIKVQLYPMLSDEHQEPFATEIFQKDDITWISPSLNQTHKLINPNTSGPTCITIQCYKYGKNDHKHYPYFDYLEKANIHQFDPVGDATFLWFKNQMKDEWESNETAPVAASGADA